MAKQRATNENDPRAACYVRVSSAEQARPDKPSLAQQEEKVRSHCATYDWQVMRVYSDVVSGKKWERPDLQRMLSDAEAGAFARVVFLAIDRFGRNTRDLLELSERLEELGIAVVSVKERFDTSTSSGKFFFTLLGALAELEAARIAERTSDGRKGTVADGAYLASITPYGYAPDRVNKKLVKDPEQSKVVESIYRWYIDEGLSLTAIARRLDAEKIPPPRNATSPIHRAEKWHTSMVSRILRDKRYAGEGSYAGDVMRCDGIVSLDDYRAARESASKRKQFSPRNTKSTYLLQHLVRCRRCESAAASTTIGRDSKPYYVCKGKHGRRSYWAAAQIEPLVQRWVLSFIDDPEAALAQARTYIERTDDASAAREEERRRLEERLVGLDNEEERAITLHVKGTLGEASMTKQLARVKSERATTLIALAELAKADAQRGTELVEQSFLLEAVKQMRTPRWRERHYVDALDQLSLGAGDRAQWQQTIRALVSTIWLEQDGSVSVEGRLALSGNASPPA